MRGGASATGVLLCPQAAYYMALVTLLRVLMCSMLLCAGIGRGSAR